MNFIFKYFSQVFIILAASLLLIVDSWALPLEKLHLPKGFQITLYAAALESPRELALGDNGVVFVGTLKDKVYALQPNADFTQAKEVRIIVRGLRSPNGVAFKKGALYVAEIERILRYDNILEHLDKPPKPVIINRRLPDKKWHGFRYIQWGPDDYLYISIGMPCNICLEEDERFGTIARINPNKPDSLTIYARGLRNTVGFDWDPKTHHLWFTDNGQDMLGDNLPPEEINRADKAGMDFGFPYFYGNNIPTPQYGHLKTSQGMTPPVYELPAHTAPLGLRFYQGGNFPKAYQGNFFIAEHGSWNRSEKTGYQVIRGIIEDNTIISIEPFVSGWLQNDIPWGRPVDLLIMPDGALLISDDLNGVIYRVSYKDTQA